MHKTDWLHASRWGLCFHYLADEPGQRDAAAMTPGAWNAQVEAFDVPRFIHTIKRCGAAYFLLTVGQNSGYYCSPNETYEACVGRSADASRLSRRDLIADIGRQASREGVRLCVYLPSHAPANDPEAIERLGCTPAWDPSRWGFKPGTCQPAPDRDDALTAFQLRWESIVREWSLRWVKGVHAWWIDGCYYADRMYRRKATPNFHSFAAALRAGNPDSLVAFNGGTSRATGSLTPAEDYIAGETNHLLVAGHGWAPGRWVDGKQLHLLTYLGEAWGRGEPRFTADLVTSWTAHVNAIGGVVTWDVPIHTDGSLPEQYLNLLESMGR